jgi:glycosyltransferase 2 family protein
MSRGSKRLLILIAASVLSIAAILYFTVEERTGEALSDVRPVYLIALFGCWVAILLFDAGSIILYTRGADEKIGFIAALKTTTVRIFFNAVTPFSLGGQPFSVFSLHREGIPTGKGSSIVITKLMTLAAFLQVGAFVSFLLFSDRITTITALNKIFMICGVVGGGTILLLTFGFLYPQILVVIIIAVGKFLHKIHILKNPSKLRRKLIMQASTARRSFKRYFTHHLGLFISGTLCNGLVYATQLLMLWLIFLGLGIDVSFLTGLVLGSMLIFLLTFMPTPGAIGLGEAVFLILFSKTVPSYMIGIAIVLWRFFFHYLSAILGAVNSSKYISDVLTRKKNA